MHALPDVEVFQAAIMRCQRCEAEYPRTDRGGTPYRDTNDETTCCHGERLVIAGDAWWYWFCLPDSDPVGPFATREEALADARDGGE